MGVGRFWGLGHGREFEVLMKSLGNATGIAIDKFAGRLRDDDPIMEARKEIQGPGPFERHDQYGSKLSEDWDPAITQFRWYDRRAQFWLNATSSPYQIDRIMRRGLLEACKLKKENSQTTFQFAGSCEHPDCEIHFAQTGKLAKFWIYLPDHYGSDDGTASDRENRPLALFIDDEPLHLDHGFPVRLIAPNRPGVSQTKWVASLVVR